MQESFYYRKKPLERANSVLVAAALNKKPHHTVRFFMERTTRLSWIARYKRVCANLLELLSAAQPVCFALCSLSARTRKQRSRRCHYY